MVALRQGGAKSEEEKPEGRGEVTCDTAVQSYRLRLGFRAYSVIVLYPVFTPSAILDHSAAPRAE